MEEKQMIAKKNTIIPLILGILSIIGCTIPIIGIVLGIVAIVLSKKEFKHCKMSKIALVLGVIGLVISLIICISSTIIIWKHMGLIK